MKAALHFVFGCEGSEGNVWGAEQKAGGWKRERFRRLDLCTGKLFLGKMGENDHALLKNTLN